MDKKLVLAVAGSGKTTEIINKVNCNRIFKKQKGIARPLKWTFLPCTPGQSRKPIP